LIKLSLNREYIIQQITASFETGEVRLLAETDQLDTDDFCMLNIETILGRQQPVLCSLSHCQQQGFNILSLKTPLGSLENLSLLEAHYDRFKFPYENDMLMVRLCYNDKASKDSLYGVYMRTDLPVLPHESLSRYELNESLRNLIECADMVERLVFQEQDIGIETKKLPEKPANNTNSLRAENKASKLFGKWKPTWNPKYVELLEKIDQETSISEVWNMNHNGYFIRFLNARSRLDAVLTYLSKDIQESEQVVLEKYFDTIVKK